MAVKTVKSRSCEGRGSQEHENTRSLEIGSCEAEGQSGSIA